MKSDPWTGTSSPPTLWSLNNPTYNYYQKTFYWRRPAELKKKATATQADELAEVLGEPILLTAAFEAISSERTHPPFLKKCQSRREPAPTLYPRPRQKSHYLDSGGSRKAAILTDSANGRSRKGDSHALV